MIAYGLLSITYVAVVLTLCLSCQPTHHFWQINPDPGPLCTPTNSPACEQSRTPVNTTTLKANIPADVLICVVPNVLTDIYLLSIPLPVSHNSFSAC